METNVLKPEIRDGVAISRDQLRQLGWEDSQQHYAGYRIWTKINSEDIIFFCTITETIYMVLKRKKNSG
ncbi:hypothetical protein K9M09_02950 [Patescibacteria group bacterium]|nr:hypothetical protein [Patescibacteria group bacterium]